MSGDHTVVSRGDLFPSTASSDAGDTLIRQIADRSPTVTLVVASNGRLVYANQAAHRAAGCEADTLPGLIATDAFPFVDPAVLAGKPPGPTQTRQVIDRHSGEATWWDVSYVQLDAASPDGECLLITAVDVTRHEIARLTAEAAQHTLDALLNYLPEGITIAYGPQVRVDRISAWGMALVGRKANELTDRSALQQTDVWDVYRPGSAVPLAPGDRPLARATRTGEVTKNETLIVRCADGRMLPVLCHSGPIRDSQGQVVGALMAWQDASDLQRAQAAMRASDERLRAVLLQIPAAVFIVEGPDERVTFKSRLVDELLGNPDTDLRKAKAQLRGWAVHEDGSPYDMSEYPSRRALYRGETIRAEPMLYHRGDGRLIELEMHAGPVRSESGEIIAAVAVALDVTERRWAAARQAFLFQLQDSLRILTDPKEILTTAATHLGRHLGAARVGFGEMGPDGETVLVTNGYVDGVPPVNGPMALGSFGPHHAAQLRDGKTVVYEDVQSIEIGGRQLSAQFGTRAHVAVPLIRDGRFTGTLYVTHTKPYQWTPQDISLVEEVAARIWDAAERGRAEARLRESEERLRLVMECSGLGGWEYDAIADKVLTSPRHDEIFGYREPVREWTKDRFKTHIPKPDLKRVDAGFREALRQGTGWDVECRMIRTDGSPGWLRVNARAHHGSDGRVVRLIGAVADITERKEAENAAIETAAKFEMLAQTLPSMIWTSLPDGQIDWFNDRVPEYCGMPGPDLKPDGWTPVHPDDVLSATTLWREALVSGKPYTTEYRIRRHDGAYRWHITRAVPIRGADGEILRWIGASADIEERKNSEQALADSNATLEQQVRERTAELLTAEARLRQSQKMEAVGQLTGGLAHDFNNLLTGISGSLELMAMRLEQGNLTQLPRYLHLARAGAQRAASLTHRLLAFSRRQTLDPKPTDINQLVYGMDDLIRRTVGPAISVEVIGAPRLWTVRADPNQLENALLNLCINARDAMPDGGSLVIETANTTVQDLEAKELDLQAADYVSLSVSDTGNGMSPEVVERAFDPFFTTKPMGEGTGLGLSMVYGFVRQSGGQARIHSTLGQGTKVSLVLPRYVGGEAMGEQAFDAHETLRGDGETVLVVDDESSVRALVNEVLEELGYHVLETDHGAAALRILQSKQRVDLLITDVGLPGGMNGRQLADAALVSRPTLKILFITGYAESAVIGKGHLQPGMHILTKPFSFETLGSRIRAIIAPQESPQK